ncbi:NADH-quinone oxidoreductase subunit N [Desulfothermobacter acidiphilus]|uniref:NADH-quinone oxidoreductase subunit N n=1 Tax=Desulfothermobacter acidiphilus TaxID=1938353 RepID=UPI003F8C292B
MVLHWELLYLEIATAALGLLLLAGGLLLPRRFARATGYLAAIGFCSLGTLAWVTRGVAGMVLPGYVIEPYSTYFKLLFLVAALLAAVCSFDYTEFLARYRCEYYALLTFATLGMMVLATSGELITLYLGLELMAVSFYVLTACRLDDSKSAEAGTKYLLLGAFSSAVLLYGFSLVYGSCGTTVLREVAACAWLAGKAGWDLKLGLALIVAGFAFKITAVPFHMWAPDVYEGAPTPVTAFLSVASKAAALAALIRLLLVGLLPLHHWWLPLILALSVMSMILGNLVAIPQANIKRLLAYSSIAQAGYLLLGLISASLLGIGAILYYAMLYVFGNMGAFMVATAFYRQDGSDLIADYAGLSRRSPLSAAVMLLALFSLAGIPPLAGFPGKLYLFMAVVARGHLWLALLAVLMSAVSVYYYLRVVKAMYWGEATLRTAPLRLGWGMRVALALILLLLLVLGFYPTLLTRYAMEAAFTLPVP